MKAIIVDDEPGAITLIKNYLEHFEAVELINTFRSPLQAFEFISRSAVDLVFLDINMPHVSGMALSKLIPRSARIIFTTAYPQYAVESYEVEATDYLLKPVSLERFTKAMHKVFAQHPENPVIDENKIRIKSGARVFQVNTADILYLKKEGNYMMYYLDGQKILTRESISEAMQKLPAEFCRVHKSYIVHLKKIDHFDKKDITIADSQIPIGQSYKRDFLSNIR